MSRKTFSVEALRLRVNTFCVRDEAHSPIARQALITQLSMILHETGNYNGFTFLSSKEIHEPNVAPGINVNSDGTIVDNYEGRFAGTDNTRVRYF